MATCNGLSVFCLHETLIVGSISLFNLLQPFLVLLLADIYMIEVAHCNSHTGIVRLRIGEKLIEYEVITLQNLLFQRGLQFCTPCSSRKDTIETYRCLNPTQSNCLLTN
ncbi:hypothetical protein O6H91_Y021500 [Diphasiastrum complanatum]|nr:hypothetical protein O6H91_Y021500 [Diphasiastrum complanatum]